MINLFDGYSSDLLLSTEVASTLSWRNGWHLFVFNVIMHCSVVKDTKRRAHIVRLIHPQTEMGKESSSNPVQWLNRMVSEPYYLFHFLSFFSYLVVRCAANQVLAPHLTRHLLHRVILSLSLSLSYVILYRLLTCCLSHVFAGNTNTVSVCCVGCHQGTCYWNQIGFVV